MTFPSVSFICTFYNKAAFVSTVLSSIQSQRHLGEAEYIFVDDGSTDDTLKLLREMTKDWENCSIVTQPNAGQTAATITGLKLAKNDFIKMWDGDDYAHPDLTYLLIDACEKHGVDYGYCKVDYGLDTEPGNYQVFNDWMETLPVSEAIVQRNILQRVLHSPITNPTGSVFRRSLLEKVKLPDPRVVIPDIYMSFTAALFTDFAYIPCPMAFAFRNVPGRTTGNEAQIMHDLNAALACFYANFHEQLPYKMKLYIGRRATGRARLWARRRHKQGMSSLYGRLALRAFLPVPMKAKNLFTTCGAFRQGNAKIRIGPDMVGVSHD
jgi:glycosyltransferase involved in cell wall biosynthesis